MFAMAVTAMTFCVRTSCPLCRSPPICSRAATAEACCMLQLACVGCTEVLRCKAGSKPNHRSNAMLRRRREARVKKEPASLLLMLRRVTGWVGKLPHARHTHRVTPFVAVQRQPGSGCLPICSSFDL